MKLLKPKTSNLKPKKGFTLIELLIVIAILGLLASIVLVGLGGARAKARDSRRIADLRQVQNALEIYYATKGEYPNVSSWGDLSTALINANIGITQISNDPLSGHTYAYGIDSSDRQHYVLQAGLEQDNPVLSDDVDGTFYTVSCDDAAPGRYYCVRF